MSIDPDDIEEGARGGARKLLARAAAAESYARRRVAFAIDDFFLPDDARIDDRQRAVLGATLVALIELIEKGIRGYAGGLLPDLPDVAAKVVQGAPVVERLVEAGLLRDADLLYELIGRVRLDLLADHLPPAAPENIDQPGLMAQLTGSTNPGVAAATRALMLAAGARRGLLDGLPVTNSELPAELHHRVVWWIAAAIREQVGSVRADQAIAESALRALAIHDESDSVEGAANRLARVIDALPMELPALLYHAIAERQLALFVALLARALGADYAAMRDVVTDDRTERLWLALRGAELRRTEIARIALLRTQLQPVAEIEALVVQIDAIAAIPAVEARGALAALRLPPDFRAAVEALGDRK